MRESPSESEGTATTDAGTGTGTGAGQSVSSRATSWHSDVDAEAVGEAVKAQVRAQARALGMSADTFGAEEGESLGPLGGGGGSLLNGNGEHKPRAYSAETAASGGGERGPLMRADSDPVRKMLRGAS